MGTSSRVDRVVSCEPPGFMFESDSYLYLYSFPGGLPGVTSINA